jgi:hypothetical protein
MHTYKRLGAALAVFAALGIGVAAQTHGEPEDFTAFAVASDNLGSGAGTVTISVDRWATDAERDKLIATLREKGPRAMMNALQDMRRAGYIRTSDSLGHPLYFAHQTAGEDGGRDIMIVTDRPIEFWEAWENSRSTEYPFMVVQMKIASDGQGTGTLSDATKILSYGNILHLENFTTAPIRLTRIQASKDE